jgi:lipopolysaccharide biosynthesis glycosyltransferase
MRTDHPSSHGDESEVMKTSTRPAVVFALCDTTGTYWMYTATAIASLLQYASVKPRIFVMHDGSLGAKAQSLLERIASVNQTTINFIKVSVKESLSKLNLGHYTLASLFRLLIPRVFSDEALVAYLDSDLICHGLDITTLFDACAGCSALYAVQDPFIGQAPSHRSQLDTLGLSVQSYFNSGVLVFRPQRVDHDLFDAFLAWWRQRPQTSHPDQDFLNHHFRERWVRLDESFNFQVTVFDRRLFLTADQYWKKVLHFAGKIKPIGHLAPGLLAWYVSLGLFPELQQHLPQVAQHYLLEVPNRAHVVKRTPIALHDQRA